MKNINRYYKAPAKQWSYIRPLRTLLYKILDEGIDENQDTIIYNLLVYLAEKKPINDKSYIDMMSIPKGESFSLATGHQYNINNLAHWIKEKKNFVSPHDNLMLFPRDIERLKQTCLDKGKELVKPCRKVSREDLALNSHELEIYRIPVFSIQHQAALGSLMTGNIELTRQQALQELTALQPYQAAALSSLYNYGLRGNHFRSAWGEYTFTENHAERLGSFMLTEQHSPIQAMAEMQRQDNVVRYTSAQRPRFFEPMPPHRAPGYRIENSQIVPQIRDEDIENNNTPSKCSFFTAAITVSSVASAAIVALSYI